MRVLLFVAALLMPAIAWLSQRGVFGPTNGEVSDRYPTLLVAEGYAFSIWGLIFLADLALSVYQLVKAERLPKDFIGIRPRIVAGFILTAIWMPIFSNGLFWLALLVIWLGAAALAAAAIGAHRIGSAHDRRYRVWIVWPLCLHAGWLSLAAFLNTAQVVVAYELLPTYAQLPWSLALFAGLAAWLLTVNRKLDGRAPYALAAVWGLIGVAIAQSSNAIDGAAVAVWVAGALAVVLTAQTVWIKRQRRREAPAERTRT